MASKDDNEFLMGKTPPKDSMEWQRALLALDELRRAGSPRPLVLESTEETDPVPLDPADPRSPEITSFRWAAAYGPPKQVGRGGLRIVVQHEDDNAVLLTIPIARGADSRELLDILINVTTAPIKHGIDHAADNAESTVVTNSCARCLQVVDEVTAETHNETCAVPEAAPLPAVSAPLDEALELEISMAPTHAAPDGHGHIAADGSRWLRELGAWVQIPDDLGGLTPYQCMQRWIEKREYLEGDGDPCPNMTPRQIEVAKAAWNNSHGVWHEFVLRRLIASDAVDEQARAPTVLSPLDVEDL